MLIYGTLWLGICNLVCGFCNNYIAFVVMRALAGIGGGFIMPNAVAILTITNPPGPTRNLLLGFFGASAPLGGWLGALFLGLIQQYTEYKWFFLLMYDPSVDTDRLDSLPLDSSSAPLRPWL
jgi:MFS family permease